MPIYKVGYRKWEGKKTSPWGRWWIIGETGFRLAFKSAWVKRALFVCWLPIVIWGVCVFMVENQLEFQPELQHQIATATGESPDKVSENVKASFEEFLDDEVLPALQFAKEVKEKIESEDTNEIEFDGFLGHEFRRIFRRTNYNPEFAKSPPIEVFSIDEDGEKQPILIADRDKLLNRIDRFIIQSESQIERAKDRANMTPQQMMINEFLTYVESDLPVLPRVDILREKLSSGKESAFRHTIWSWLLMTFFRYPQGTLILFLLGYIAPGLISRDLRSRAYLLYFSRPIGRLEYIAGKMATIGSYIVMVSTLPAIGLFIFSVMLSPDISALTNTWDIIPRILAASAVLVIPLSALALMLSSLTHESRFATFAWFAIWALGHGAWMVIVLIKSIQLGQPPGALEVMQSDMVTNWSVLSLYNNLGRVQSWIFGFETFDQVWPPLFVLIGITAFSLFILFRRVSAPIRA